MLSDIKLLDLVRKAFNYKTDREVANFLGVNDNTIYGIRNNRSVAGEKLRLKILTRFKILDKVAFRCAEDFFLRYFEGGKANSRPRDEDAMPILLTSQVLVLRIRELRKKQHQRWGKSGSPDDFDQTDDVKLLDEYKSFMNIPTDTELAKALGITGSSISMVRKGRHSLGPQPRLRIFRDAFNVDVSELLAALGSSRALLALIKEYRAS